MAHGPLDERRAQGRVRGAFRPRLARRTRTVLRRRSNDPTIGDVCVLLADLSGPAPEVELKPAAPGRAKSAKIAKGKRASRSHAATAKHASAKKKAKKRR